MTATGSAYPPKLALVPADEPPEASPLSARMKDALCRRLDAYPFIEGIDVADEPSLLPAPTSSTHLRRRVSSPQGRCWAQVSWEPGDDSRDELVRALVELTETRCREDELLAERTALWERFDGLRERMVERKRTMAIGTMAAGVAHDIRTPLSVLVANLSYLEHLASEVPGTEEELESISEDNKLALELIRGVLDSMRTFVESSDTPSLLKVGPILQSAVRLSRWHFSRKRSYVEVSIEGSPTVVSTNGELCQILLNLLSNAADATPDHSVVRVVARRNGDETRIWVADEGQGVRPDQAEAIFEPFHTSKVDGMGLGLSLAREMARRHGGDVRLLSVAPLTLGQPAPSGAVFEIRLPACAASRIG